MAIRKNRRSAQHINKIARKKIARATVMTGFMPVDDTRFAGLRMQFALRGQPVIPNVAKGVRWSKNSDAAYRKPFIRIVKAA